MLIPILLSEYCQRKKKPIETWIRKKLEINVTYEALKIMADNLFGKNCFLATILCLLQFQALHTCTNNLFILTNTNSDSH